MAEILLAPLSGWVTGLEAVPDAVFAGGMMGDGLAIDPTSAVLCAPCDGTVLLLHAAGHAVTIRTRAGADILLHVGLDTVALAGRGFTAHVAQGDDVKAGAALITFDLDILAHAARSLVTPIILTNGGGFALEKLVQNQSAVQGQPIMRLSAVAGGEVRHHAIVRHAHGIHARPAAQLAALAKSFSADVVVMAGNRRASAQSPVALMGLGLVQGARLTIIASGKDAGAAAAALAAIIEGAQETVSVPGIRGISAAPGLAHGTARWLTAPRLTPPERGAGEAAEKIRLAGALALVRARLGAASSGGKVAAAIRAAHLVFLDDAALAAAAAEQMAAGKSAGHAWAHAIRFQAGILAGLADARLRERAADLADLEHQVLVALGDGEEDARSFAPGTILLAEDILPSQLLGLGGVAGIATMRGGPTSHVAILASAMNIPALVACGLPLQEIPEGASLLLDADRGAITPDPTQAQIEGAQDTIAKLQALHARAADAGRTADDTAIEILANLGGLGDAAAAMAAGAEGCGLLRTEFLFLDRIIPPSEQEQAEIYRAIAAAIAPRPLTIRTLDIGADKHAPWLALAVEDNPALGLRGLRLSLARPDILLTQLCAILKAVPPGQCRIMAPMVTSLEELRRLRAYLDEARARTGAQTVKLGVMVETPAAALTADILAAEADFLSIGTNDLAQYCLAMDRGNADVAATLDALHPAVLRLIAATVDGAALHHCPVSVCGGLASDPVAAPLLVGLGVRSLSAAPARIAAVKARLRDLTLDECRARAQKALAASDAGEVRRLGGA